MHLRKRCTAFNWIQNNGRYINQVFLSYSDMFCPHLWLSFFSAALASPSMISNQVKPVPQTHPHAYSRVWPPVHIDNTGKHLYYTQLTEVLHSTGKRPCGVTDAGPSPVISQVSLRPNIGPSGTNSKCDQSEKTRSQSLTTSALLTIAITQYWSAGLSQQCGEEWNRKSAKNITTLDIWFSYNCTRVNVYFLLKTKVF